MTKKTNSLLFRLGINSLWQSKMSNFIKNFDTFRLEKTLKGELVKFNWNILSIKWYKFKIFIQIYNKFCLSKFIKQNVFKYYKKYKNIKKIYKKFNLNLIFLKLILKKIKKLSKINKNNLKFLQISLLFLFFKKLKLNMMCKLIVRLKYFNWLKILLLFRCGFNYIKIKGSYRFYRDKKLVLKNKFYKINGVLYFKLLSISTEILIFNLTKKYIQISFNNVWNNQGWVLKIKSKKNLKENYILKVLFLSCFHNNTQIFSDYIAFNLKKNKNHKKFLRQIILIIEKFWKIRKISLRGIQLRVTGKIDGRMRKSKYHYSIGKVQLQSLQTNLNYSISLSYTKFGVISIKFWILYGNKKI
jgi:hypothetical protein